MLKVSLRDRNTNKVIGNRTRVVDAIEKISKLKSKCAGDIFRTRDERWSKKIIELMPRLTLIEVEVVP